MTNEVVVVIPARGGSKGIPRKNLRIFAGQPLVAHAIETAKAATKVTRVVVTSDDTEILEIAEHHGVIAFERDPKFASDQATLDPVIAEVVEALHLQDAIVVTMQTTCPLIRPGTVDRVVEEVEARPEATSFTVVENRHLTWMKNDAGFQPNYEKRVNRQELPPVFAETGGVVACRGDKITSHNTRFVAPYSPVSVSEVESIDIDTAHDWAKAESALRQKRIAVFVTGNETIGLGHLYRQLTLYDHFAKHDVRFFCPQEDTLVQKILSDKFIKVEAFDAKSIGPRLKDFAPDIIINDVLDDWIDLIDAQNATKAKVLVFETEAHAPDFEHEVINALYPVQHSNDRVGPDWFVLRPEFLLVTPRAVADEVKEILVTFGGVDPSDQSFRLYNILRGEAYRGTSRKIVLGKGYHGALLHVRSSEDVEIIRDTTQISRYMERADLAVTSKGRTIYELAKCGVPTVSISQNDREQRHDFGEIQFKDLGLHSQVSDSEIELAFQEMMSDVQLRRNLSHNSRAISFNGIRNILSLIEE